MTKRPKSEHDFESLKLELEMELTPSAVSQEMKMLPQGFQPGPKDAICSRGKTAFDHNINFREVVREHLPQYSEASSKLEKSLIVTNVVEVIRRGSPNGGFVRKVDGQWVEVGDIIAREKVGGAFREMLHTKYQSSSKSKIRRRKDKLKAAQQAGLALAGRNSAPPTYVARNRGQILSSGCLAPIRRRQEIELSAFGPPAVAGHFSQTGNDAPRPPRQETEWSEYKIHPNGLFGPLLQDINSRKQQLVGEPHATQPKIEEPRMQAFSFEPPSEPPKLHEFRLQEHADGPITGSPKIEEMTRQEFSRVFNSGPPRFEDTNPRLSPPLEFPLPSNWLSMRSSPDEYASSVP